MKMADLIPFSTSFFPSKGRHTHTSSEVMFMRDCFNSQDLPCDGDDFPTERVAILRWFISLDINSTRISLGLSSKTPSEIFLMAFLLRITCSRLEGRDSLVRLLIRFELASMVLRLNPNLKVK